MFSRFATLAVMASMMAFAAGCSSTPGNGVAASEKRTLTTPFGELEINTVSARIVVDPTVTTTEIEVRGDSNLVPMVSTRVEGGKLIVNAGDGDVDPKLALEVIFKTPRMGRIEATGDSRVDITMTSDTTLEVKAAGDAWIVGHGKIARLEGDLAGNAHLEARELVARQVDLDAAGSSVVAVCATESLKVDLAGSNVTDYYCDPRQVDDEVSSNAHLHYR